MPEDTVGYGRVLELAHAAAQSRGLVTTDSETDETLRISVGPGGGFHRGSDPRPGRDEVSISTYGTGAFLVDFDERWTWQAFGYDEQEQAETIREIIKVVELYLRGAGQVQVRRTWFGRLRRSLLITSDTGDVVLNARDG